MKQRSPALLILLGSLPLFLFLSSLMFVSFACHRERVADATETSTIPPGAETDTASATHPASPGGTAVIPDVSSGTTVVVVLEDNHIGLKGQAIPPGPAVLTIENTGTQVHNLFIEGEGINRAAGDTIPQGETRSVDVVFQPGTYTFYCPVLNHRQNGEQEVVTVGTAQTTDTATTTSG